MSLILILILSILVGIGIGFLLRRKAMLWLDNLIMLWVCLLLFLIGIEVGGDENILASFHVLGYKAVLLAFCTTLGAMLAAWGLWRVVRNKGKTKNKPVS